MVCVTHRLRYEEFAEVLMQSAFMAKQQENDDSLKAKDVQVELGKIPKVSRKVLLVYCQIYQSTKKKKENVILV